MLQPLTSSCMTVLCVVIGRNVGHVDRRVAKAVGDHLGRHPQRRARQAVARADAVQQLRGNAKVCQLGDAVLRQNDVAALHVAVDGQPTFRLSRIAREGRRLLTAG